MDSKWPIPDSKDIPSVRSNNVIVLSKTWLPSGDYLSISTTNPCGPGPTYFYYFPNIPLTRFMIHSVDIKQTRTIPDLTQGWFKHTISELTGGGLY